MEGRKMGKRGKGTGRGMSARRGALRQGGGMRDEGEQGVDRWLEGRAVGGAWGVFPGTAFSCTRTTLNTELHTVPRSALRKPTQKHTLLNCS